RLHLCRPAAGGATGTAVLRGRATGREPRSPLLSEPGPLAPLAALRRIDGRRGVGCLPRMGTAEIGGGGILPDADDRPPDGAGAREQRFEPGPVADAHHA